MAFLAPVTSQAERIVKALGLEFPGSMSGRPFRSAFGTLHMTGYARPIGTVYFACQMDCNSTQVESSCFQWARVCIRAFSVCAYKYSGRTERINAGCASATASGDDPQGVSNETL
jgi:hypothetical protein